MTPADLPERIASKIEVDPETQCWIWVAGVNSVSGYGMVRWGKSDDGRYLTAYAHRLTYHLLADPTFPVFGGWHGVELDHLGCDKRCVNPRHVEPVEKAENSRRYRERAGLPESPVLRALRSSGPVTSRELAAYRGANHSSTCRGLSALVAAGDVVVVGIRRVGRRGPRSRVFAAVAADRRAAA